MGDTILRVIYAHGKGTLDEEINVREWLGGKGLYRGAG